MSILTRPVGKRDANPVEQFVYLAAASCHSSLEDQEIEVYLVMESLVPFTKNQMLSLQSLVPIVKAELDVQKLKNELKVVVYALKSIKEESVSRDERLENVSWALHSQMQSFQFLHFLSSFADCSGFNEDVFWHEKEHFYDDTDKSVRGIPLCRTKTSVSIEDISDNLKSILKSISPDICSSGVVEVPSDKLVLKEKGLKNKGVRFALDENISDANIDHYSLLSLKDNCCVAVISQKVGESCLYVPIGQLTPSSSVNNEGNSYVLAVFFVNEKAIAEFLVNKEQSAFLQSLWHEKLPRPHADMIPMIRIDGPTSSILSKKLEPPSWSVNFLFHITLSIRKCLEVQNLKLLRKLDTVF